MIAVAQTAGKTSLKSKRRRRLHPAMVGKRLGCAIMGWVRCRLSGRTMMGYAVMLPCERASSRLWSIGEGRRSLFWRMSCLRQVEEAEHHPC